MADGKAEEMAAFEQSAIPETEMVYQGKKVSLRLDKMVDHHGRGYVREIVVHNGAVVMVPVDHEGKIILVRQWRRAVGKILTELPAGTVEKGEDPFDCAGRELQEEIGYKAAKLTPMGGFYSAPGFCTEYLWLYLAEELSESQLEPDAHEAIDTVRVTVDKAVEWIENGTICDAKSVAGILRYRNYLAKK